MKIVIADDEVLVRKGISMSIDWKTLGIDEVFEASDGQQAYEIIKKNQIDILLTDIKMPKMGGIELLEKVRIMSPYTVCIVLSCMNDMEYVREALKFNRAIDYIPKLTMSTDELQSVIKRALGYVQERAGDQRNEGLHLAPFFTGEEETKLRHVMEYGSQQEIEECLHRILDRADILKTEWRKSDEWEDVVNVFVSIGKKYEIYKKDVYMEELHRALARANNKPEFENSLLRMAYAIREEVEQARRESYDLGVSTAVKHIKEHYMENLKLKDVADVSGMSEAYFSRLFKKVMGEGFSTYLNNCRIEEAKRLFLKKRMTVQEVAEAVGYTNAAYFTQAFKNAVGISPKAYQLQKAKEEDR